MLLRTKIEASYLVRAKPNTRVVFRGTNDVYPSKVKPLYSGGGIFGSGTYLGLDLETAQQYVSSSDEFGLVCQYEFSSRKPAEITPDDFDGLAKAHKNKLTIKSQAGADLVGAEIGDVTSAKILSSKAKEAGIDALFFLGKVDGGSQVLVPPGSKPEVKLEKFYLYIHEDSEWTHKKVRKAFSVAEEEWRYGNSIRFGPFPASDWDKVDTFLRDAFGDGFEGDPDV